jgi:hypothetical protein
MNPEPVHAALKAVITRVLEEAAFIFSDDLSGEEKPSAVAWNPSGVSLSFTGQRSGTLRLWATPALLPLLSSNMLGLDAGSDRAREKGIDALRETANIVLGNFLTEYYGTEAVFNLDIPVCADPALLQSDCHDDAGIWLQAEGNALLTVVMLEGGIRSP